MDDDVIELDEENTDFFNFHYVWIKDLSRLVSNQSSRGSYRKYIYDRCLHYSLSEAKLTKHTEICKKINQCRVTLPKPENNIVKFKNFNNQVKVLFVVYADCESFLIPVEESPEKISNTKVIQHHEILSIGYYLKCSYDDTLSKYKACPENKADPSKWFAEELRQLAEDVETVFICSIRMEDDYYHKQQVAFEEATICHICKQDITPREKKIKDHCHLTGKYQGPAHENCNLSYQDYRTVTVQYYTYSNLSAYDAHFIICAIFTQFKGRVNLLPLNKEKYIKFTKNINDSEIKFRFIDSFRFMASLLDKLALYIDVYPIVSSTFPYLTRSSPSMIQLSFSRGPNATALYILYLYFSAIPLNSV